MAIGDEKSSFGRGNAQCSYKFSGGGMPMGTGSEGLSFAQSQLMICELLLFNSNGIF